MDIQTNNSNMIIMIPIIFCGLVIMAIIILALYYFVKKQDDNKELVTQMVKVLEKPVQQGNIEWYVVECENKERIKLRSFQADKVIKNSVQRRTSFDFNFETSIFMATIPGRIP